MLLTKYEWQLGVLTDSDNAPVGTWKGVVISQPAFLLYHQLANSEAEGGMVLIDSIDGLIEELACLQSEQPDEQVAVDILSPTRGAQPVCELWSYESEQEPTLYYAYMGRDGRLEPCNREQPRYMTRLRRLYTLGTHAAIDGDLCAQGA
ncbi:hypothetical protein DN412_03040 [Cupriavidus lacunae]|uniref:Uncharacterized protein n=2 Tax=Cupriavidus lacunae TaxID=2666307 RepID=A0A370P231_9BURK|nr:hypothetical protein DN412_03040 [Cupriavidus lacunae]